MSFLSFPLPGLSLPGLSLPEGPLPGLSLPGLFLPGLPPPRLPGDGLTLPGLGRLGLRFPGPGFPGLRFPGPGFPGFLPPGLISLGIGFPRPGRPGPSGFRFRFKLPSPLLAGLLLPGLMLPGLLERPAPGRSKLSGLSNPPRGCVRDWLLPARPDSRLFPPAAPGSAPGPTGCGRCGRFRKSGLAD